MLDEQELVRNCSRGDRAAQKKFYDCYSLKLMAIACRYCRTRAEAEDVLQEAFVKIFNNLKNFRFESRLDTWMTRVVINTALNHHRQKLYLLPMVDVDNANLQVDEHLNLAEFHLSELIAMVQALPDGCRVVFNLFAVEGYNHKEIAEMLSISEGTSKSQYHRAKQLLREKLERMTTIYEAGKKI